MLYLHYQIITYLASKRPDIFQLNIASEFQKDKIKYERNKEEVDNLVNPASEFLASSKVDDIRASRVGSLRYDYMTATDKVEYKFTDEKTEVGFISSPDLINFKPNQTRLDFISITGFLIAKTTDEDNKFEIPADGNAYKIPVYLYLEETPAQLQDEKIDEKAYENDELSLNEAADKLSKEFSNIVHFEIIEDENLPVEEVNCERTLKYYFPYDTDKVKESKYYTEEFLDKLRSFPDYRGEDIRQENIKPARWHDQTPIVIYNIFSSANNHPSVSIDDPDKINNLFFY